MELAVIDPAESLCGEFTEVNGVNLLKLQQMEGHSNVRDVQ